MHSHHHQKALIAPLFRSEVKNDCPDYVRMRNFVNGKGGRIRFDEFAREHLTGPTGFYSTRVDVSKPGSGVPTPCSSEPMYRAYLVATVAQYAAACCAQKAEELKTRPLTFCEIGGGAGLFKRDFIALWGRVARQHSLPELRYISVDVSANHRAAQGKYGNEVIEGTATATNLPDNSVDVLFDEEVLDCLPFRLFTWDARNQKIAAEAYVVVDRDALCLNHEPTTNLDRYAYHTEAALAQRGYRFPYYRYAPEQWNYLIESSRVLRHDGMRISSDYSDETLGLITGDNLGEFHKNLNFPYQDDLTHGVDFLRLATMARLHRIGGQVQELTQAFAEISERVPREAMVTAMTRSIFVGIKF